MTTQLRNSKMNVFDRDNAEAVYWEMYKDAHGVRPRGIDTSTWSEQEFKTRFDNLQKLIAENEAFTRESEARMINSFELELLRMQGSLAQKIGVLHKKHRSNGDVAYLEYLLGVPYGYIQNKLTNDSLSHQ